MKKIICVIGARPQFIKHFPLELALSKTFDVKTIHTGQHYDENMSRVFFDQLGIRKPDYHFNLNKSSHGGQTAEMLELIENILIQDSADLMLVYGDTNSTLAGALAAAKLNIPIIHVEAGLRSYNREMPEEVNRILTDHVSSQLFCSSDVGKANLTKEGVKKGVEICGDLMKDALVMLLDSLKPMISYPYALATLHRPYNTDNPKRLLSILNELNGYKSVVIFPIHPRTRNILSKENLDRFKNIRFIDPVGYIDMLSYLKGCQLMITDSGGVQKEAYWMKKQCVTIRKETEWIETLRGGWNTLLFEDLSLLKELTEPDESLYDSNLYGAGDSADKIVKSIENYFCN